MIIAILTLTEKPSNASTSVIVALYNRSLPVRMKRLSGRVRTTNCKQDMTLASASTPSEFWQFLPFAFAAVLLCHCNADCVKLNSGAVVYLLLMKQETLKQKNIAAMRNTRMVLPTFRSPGSPSIIGSPSSKNAISCIMTTCLCKNSIIELEGNNKVSSTCVMQHDNCR